MSHPLSIASFLSNADNQRELRLTLWRNGCSADATPKGMIETTWLMPFAPGQASFFNSRLCVDNGHKLCWPNPIKVCRSEGYLQPHQLWLDSLFQSYWADLLEPRSLIVRVADHPAHIASLSKPLRIAFSRLLERAELVITPSSTNADYLRKISGRDIRVVPNGVDTAHFRRAVLPPVEFAQSCKKKVVFVGAIAQWIDVDLIAATAAQCPDIEFYIIGPNQGCDLSKLPPNATYLGSRPYSEVPRYLQHAHAAIAPFNVAAMPEFVDSIDAIKLYEYIAAGLPVVATRWAQSIKLEPYVVSTEQSAQAFAANIETVLSNPEAHRAPKAFIDTLDWNRRLNSL